MLDSGKIQIICCPMFIDRDSQLANVDDVFNGILVRGDATGDVVFYGKGAGKLPTASAVVADVIDCVKHIKARKYLFWEDGSPDYVEDYLEDVLPMYVRATAENASVALGTADALFGGVQQLSRKDAPRNELAFVTKEMKEREIREKLEQLSKMGVKVEATVRVADL